MPSAAKKLFSKNVLETPTKTASENNTIPRKFSVTVTVNSGIPRRCQETIGAENNLVYTYER